MPLNAFGDPVEQEVNAFGDPVEHHSSEIQKLNRTELAKLPQFQPEQVSTLDKLASPLSDYVVAPIANIPNAIRGIAAEGMNLPFRAAQLIGLYPKTQLRMRITPDQFDENGNVVPGSISQENVPVPLPYNANYAPQIPFNPTPMQPTQPEGLALVNKVLGMATPDVALAAPIAGQRATAAYFMPQMVAQVPQIVQHGAEQVMNPALSGRERVGAAGGALADLAMAAMVSHSAMPEASVPSGLTRADIPGYAWEDVRRFAMPDRPAIQLPDIEQPKTFEAPIIGQRPLSVGQNLVGPGNTAAGNIIPQSLAIKPEPLGGQISFNSPASPNAIPNALQQAQPSLAQMLEDVIKRNQIEREQNASSLRSNEEPLPGVSRQTREEKIQQATSGALRSGDLQQEPQTGTSANGTELRTAGEGTINDLTRSEEGGTRGYSETSHETSPPTTSDFEKYNELRQQVKAFTAKGEFPPSELLSQMEEIKNRNKGMPPKEETTVPLNERLKARLKAFNDAQAKRIQSGDSMGRIDAGLLDDVVNIGRLVYGSAKDFASWSAEMVKKLGEHVKPHLQEVWDNVKRAYDTRPTNTAMVMQAGELVSQPAKLRLGLDKDGKYDAGQAVARLRNTLGESSAEWQVLKETGIQDRFKPGQKVTPEELRGWVDENGPKVEVRKFGEGAYTLEQKKMRDEVAQLEHQMDSSKYNWREFNEEGAKPAVNWPDEFTKKFNKYINLKTQLRYLGAENVESSYWSSIAPKAEKDMPGYVEIAVTKPLKQKPNYDFRGRSGGIDIVEREDEAAGVQFPSSHSFPPNTLAFARGYMETTKDGKKVFHVIEAQTDVAQEIRDGVFGVSGHPELGEFSSKKDAIYAAAKIEPLVKYYEPLALKAAIEHAKKEGASAIAISDAETAMMTEGHDRLAQHRWLVRNENGEVLADAPSKQDAEEWVQMNEESRRRTFPDKQPLKATIEEKVESLDQEPGMRLHYDRTLPKIVEELTGQKGERVEFGEHRMAFNEGESHWEEARRNPPNEPRKDLIFRNADNTPKTSISARMFDLSKVTDEPKTLFGKDRPSEVNVEKTKEALAPKTGGINTRAGGERKGEAGSVTLEPFKDFAENTKKIVQGLATDFQVLRDQFLRKEEFSHIVAKNMAIENGALTTANSAKNSVELEAKRIFGKQSKEALNGVIAALSAEGDKNKLSLFATQAAKNKEAMEGIRFAQANWDKLQPLLKHLADIDTFNRSEAAKSGVSIPYLHDYLKRIYESDRGWLTRGTGSSGTGAGSKLPRQFDTVYQAIQFGKKPILNAAQMIGKRTGEIFNEINEHLWSEHLKSFPDSRTGEMVMAEPVRKGKMLIAPEGYINVQLPSGKTVSVLEGYDKLVKSITGESLINNSLALSALRNFGQEMKHGTLAFDTYHLAKVIMFEKSLGMKLGYKKGLSILEFSNSDLNEALRQGLITQEAVDYSRGTETTGFGPISRREIVSLGIKNGLGVGKHSEALYDSFARSIPGIGHAHKFIFDKLTRGAMAEAFVKEFTRQSKNHPAMARDQIAQMVARDLNFRMGNIQKQGIFKSATMQDLLSIPFLAPKWVEAVGQSEIRSVGQVGKALLPGGGFMKPGTLGKSSAALVATFIGVTQALNMLSTRHPTWQNPKGHQLDLFVPPVTKGGKGLWISPLSVAAEMTHDFVRLTHSGGDVLDAAGRIMSNKLSGIGRAEEALRLGVNWKGEKLHGWDRIEAAIGAMFNPLPLPIKQTTESIKAKDYTPAERQGFAMIGVKGEPESYNEQKQRIIDNMKSAKPMTLYDRKQLEEQLKSLRQTPTDAAKVAITTRATEQMLERKNGLRDELPNDIKSWLKKENLDITGFDNAFSYRKTRIGLTQDEADRYKEIVKDAYVQYLSGYVGQQMTQQKLNGVMEKAKNYARKQMKSEMQQ